MLAERPLYGEKNDAYINRVTSSELFTSALEEEKSLLGLAGN